MNAIDKAAKKEELEVALNEVLHDLHIADMGGSDEMIEILEEKLAAIEAEISAL